MIDIPIRLKKEYRLNRQNIIKNTLKKYKNNEEKLNQLNEKLKKDDKNYTRKHIRYKQNNIYKYIKLRLENPTNQLDKHNLANNIAASSNHADDASILIISSEKLSNLKINHTLIHDSIGTNLKYSIIIKHIYKNSIIEYID
jgi:alanyl-tRNA synthetase